jgi:putative transposase
MERIDELFTEDPTRGTRRLKAALHKRFGIDLGRSKIRSLMARMGLSAIYQAVNTSQPNKAHKKYPYLLRNVKIDRVKQVWSTDITYIRLKGGFVYLCAVIDWYSRYVLSWRLSTTLDSSFCVDAVEEAISTYGVPDIFNTDQGCQFTSESFTSVLSKNGIRISMDGRGRALDNVFIERLWRTVKYENIFIRGYESVSECRSGLTKYLYWYNNHREHSSLGGNYPMEIYFGHITLPAAA